MLSQEEIDSLLSSLGGDASPPKKNDAPESSVSTLPGISHPGSSDHPASSLNLNTQVSPRNYKLYNFKRPDKFSKDHLRALQSIHENFSRQFGMILTTYLRMPVEVDVVSVDQLTYDEFIRSMPNPMTVGILEMDPLPGQTLIGFSHEVTSSIIDRMLGGPGLADPYPRELTDIEQSLIRRVIERSMSSLEEAWQNIIPITVALTGMEESYTMIQVATPGEIVALITFEVNIGNGKSSGLISLGIPYPVLETVMGQLSAQNLFHGKQQGYVNIEEQLAVLKKLHYAKVPVQVLLGGTRLSVRDMMNLRVGDVIRLDRKASSPLLTCVNGIPKFFCRPGKLGKNLAVYVYNPIDKIEAIEGFGLNEQ